MLKTDPDVQRVITQCRRELDALFDACEELELRLDEVVDQYVDQLVREHYRLPPWGRWMGDLRPAPQMELSLVGQTDHVENG